MAWLHRRAWFHTWRRDLDFGAYVSNLLSQTYANIKAKRLHALQHPHKGTRTL